MHLISNLRTLSSTEVPVITVRRMQYPDYQWKLKSYLTLQNESLLHGPIKTNVGYVYRRKSNNEAWRRCTRLTHPITRVQQTTDAAIGHRYSVPYHHVFNKVLRIGFSTTMTRITDKSSSRTKKYMEKQRWKLIATLLLTPYRLLWQSSRS